MFLDRFRKRQASDEEKAGPYDEYRRLGVKIGKRCHVYGTNFDKLAPFLIELGDDVSLAGGVSILAHDAALIYVTGEERFAPVHIKDRCFIGRGTVILPGVTIGPDSIVGANATISRDVPPGEVWAGNPARRICTTKELAEKVKTRPLNRFVKMPTEADHPEHPEFRKTRVDWGNHLKQLNDEGYFR